MRQSKTIRLINITALLFLINSCNWLGEYYVGINMQPDIDKEGFKPGLNVFGILKTGESLDTTNHYFEVQQLIFALEPESSMIVENASIKLVRYSLDGVIQQYDLEHIVGGTYKNGMIETNAGDRWEYFCEYDTFAVHSSCIVPMIPQIIRESLVQTKTNLHFDIVYDSSAFIYDVYVIAEKGFAFDRVVANRNANTMVDVQLKAETNFQNGVLYVYAYDKQFESYFSTSSIFFKPNAYRPHFSTVMGGFGVFGAAAGAKFFLDPN
jgi:hypothetical protein